ncbi:MAG: hypothetical protein ACRCXV_00465 [Bacteroidales bacterium]
MADYISRYSGENMDKSFDKVAADELIMNGAKNIPEGININTKSIGELDKKIEANILSIDIDSEGYIVATTGSDNSAFTNGYTDNDGNIILEFNYV